MTSSRTNRRKLRILFVSQYFPPEVAAPAVRAHETCREWAQLGHDVTVLCGFPHHPSGVIPPRYRRLLVKRETLDGVKVIRTWLHAAPNKGVLRRSLSYLTFMLSAIVTGALTVRKPDVVIGTSPQMLTGVAAWALSRIKGCPFVFEVRDLWPDALRAVGLKIPGILFAALKSLELFLYDRAEQIVVVTESFKRMIGRSAVRSRNVVVVPNGVDLTAFSPGEGGAEGVAYIGTLGLAHKLDFLVEAAAAMKDTNFNLIGEGADRERLESLARRLGADNLRFWGLQPRKLVPSLIRRMDICVVALRKSRLFTSFIPSKMFEVMACGRPLILACEGEAAEIAERSGAAIVIAPEDIGSLRTAIRKLMNSKRLRTSMGHAGRRFVEEHYDRNRLSRKYLEILKRVI